MQNDRPHNGSSKDWRSFASWGCHRAQSMLNGGRGMQQTFRRAVRHPRPSSRSQTWQPPPHARPSSWRCRQRTQQRTPFLHTTANSGEISPTIACQQSLCLTDCTWRFRPLHHANIPGLQCCVRQIEEEASKRRSRFRQGKTDHLLHPRTQRPQCRTAGSHCPPRRGRCQPQAQHLSSCCPGAASSRAPPLQLCRPAHLADRHMPHQEEYVMCFTSLSRV